MNDPTTWVGCPGNQNGPIKKLSLRREANQVLVRFDFCCAEHAPVAFIETEHSLEGAKKLGADLIRAAADT